MQRIRFAFTLSLTLLATGCYTRLRAPRAVHDDVAPRAAQDDDATANREEADVPHVHTPVFVRPHYGYLDYLVHCGPYGWELERYRRHRPWIYRCGFTDRYWWFNVYDRRRQVYDYYGPAVWHDGWPVRAYLPRSGRGPRFVPHHPEVGSLDVDAVFRSRFRRRGFAGGDTIHGRRTGETPASPVRDRERPGDAADGVDRRRGRSASRPEKPIRTAGRAWRPDPESVPLKEAPGAVSGGGGGRIAERGDKNEPQTRRPARRYREDRRGRSGRDGPGSGRADRPAKPESKQVQKRPSPSSSSGPQPSSQKQAISESEEKEDKKRARREKRKESRRRKGK